MIRIAREADIPEILAVYAPYVRESTATFEYDVPSLEAFTERFHAITGKLPWLVWEEDGTILGYAYASLPFSRAAYAWCAEPSVYLRPEARGRGVAKALYTVLEEILTRQGYQVLYALVTSENAPSKRFHEKLGYVKRMELPNCAYKFGRALGLNWYEKRVKLVQTPKAFPVPWMSIVQNEEMFRDILDNLSLF